MCYQRCDIHSLLTVFEAKKMINGLNNLHLIFKYFYKFECKKCMHLRELHSNQHAIEFAPRVLNFCHTEIIRALTQFVCHSMWIIVAFSGHKT